MNEQTKKTQVLFYVTILAVVLITERIGKFTIPLGNVASITVFPFLMGMIIIFICTLIKPITFVNVEFNDTAEKWLQYGLAIYLARVGINAGSQIVEVLTAGPALLLQEFGNLGTVVFAFPLALFWGFKRESIGMTFSICREQGVAIIASRYNGLGGPEGRGVMVTYIMIHFIGTLTLSFLPGLMANLTPLHPYALAMACGVGAAAPQAAGLATLVDMFPDMADALTGYAVTSQTLSACDGTLMAVLITLPLMEVAYKKLEPLLDKDCRQQRKNSRKKAEEGR